MAVKDKNITVGSLGVLQKHDKEAYVSMADPAGSGKMVFDGDASFSGDVSADSLTISNVKLIYENGSFKMVFLSAKYVSFGDSIAAGHTIDGNWESDYGEGSQYGKNGNTETVIVPNSYTDLIRNELIEMYGKNNVSAKSFARSGDRVSDLMEKLSHETVRSALKEADIVTICIGANDVLEPALSHLDEYINTGDLNSLATIVEGNLATLNNDTAATSYTALFNKLAEINPEAQYIFTTIYNPYKYLWMEEGKNGFFSPILNSIPQMTILGIEVDEIIKDELLDTSIVQTLFKRVNGLCDWSEKYVTLLNEVLKNKIAAYQEINPNFAVADTKAVYDPFPDRPISAKKHYNDLVNVEYTRGYDTAKMDWGRLWEGSSASDFWWDLATEYVSLSGLDINGFAEDLITQIVEKVIMPDVDPHPEVYGQYVLKRSFSDVLGWDSLDRYTITFNANGGSGSMAAQEVVGVDGLPAYTNIKAQSFTPATGYYFAGWNTVSDGSGTTYTDKQLIGVTENLTLYAQWSNIYAVTYKHTNHTNLYGSDETGHMECYALYINGELKPKFGTFAQGSSTTYYVPYGSSIMVWVDDYVANEITYDSKDCIVYWNGSAVHQGHPAYHTFTLTGDTTIDFRWKIAGSLVTFNAQSWEDCYITTN